MKLYYFLCSLLLMSELIHAFVHSLVLFRILLPTFHQIQKHLWYFIFDAYSAAIASMLLRDPRSGYMVLLHFLGHFFFIITWKEGIASRNIQNWSSQQYSGPLITMDFFLTCFDIFVHLLHVVLLAKKVFHYFFSSN